MSLESWTKYKDIFLKASQSLHDIEGLPYQRLEECKN